MNTDYLLSHRYKKIGWVILIPASFIGLIWLIYPFEPSFLEIKMLAIIANGGMFESVSYFRFTETNAIDLILSVLIISGSLIVAFSRVKKEDEYIRKIRLESLVWSIFANYIILLICILFLYDFAFLYALVLNMFTVLFCFIVRFHWKLYKMPGGSSDEE